MRSPESPVVANMYMEMFEDLALKMGANPPEYGNAMLTTFCVMKITVVKGFLSHLNSLCLTIIFIMEQEVDGKLLFLDTLLHRKNNGSLDVSFYRKSTHTNCYLNFSSSKTVTCERWCSLLPLPSSTNHHHHSVGEHTRRGTPSQRSPKDNGYTEAFTKMASRPHTMKNQYRRPMCED